MADYKVNIGPYQADFSGFGYNVNIGSDQDDGLVAPQITDQSTDMVVGKGAETTLFVTVTGEPTPTYQWYKNNVILLGETNSTLVIYPTSLATYKCKISNVVGDVWSDPIVVTVIRNPYRYNVFSLNLDLNRD